MYIGGFFKIKSLNLRTLTAPQPSTYYVLLCFQWHAPKRHEQLHLVYKRFRNHLHVGNFNPLIANQQASNNFSEIHLFAKNENSSEASCGLGLAIVLEYRKFTVNISYSSLDRSIVNLPSFSFNSHVIFCTNCKKIFYAQTENFHKPAHHSIISSCICRW